MKKILLAILLGFSLGGHSQTVETVVVGWNSTTTLPDGYNPNKTYPVLIFIPGLGEVGTVIVKSVLYGPHAYLRMGVNPLPGWIIITLQPSAAYPSEAALKIRIDALRQLYNIDSTRINLTGLSHGGWCSSTYVSGIVNIINTVITVQGVIPDDNSPYPNGFVNFKGTGYVCFEQRLDGRGGQTVVNYINSLRPGIATFIETNYGGGGHCCWNSFYGGGGTQPGVFAALGDRNIYQWLIAKNAFNVVALPPVIPQTSLAIKPFYYDANNIYYKTNIRTEYFLYNIVGQAVRKGILTTGKNTIPLTGLPVGVYILQTQFDKRYKIFKWI